MRIFHVITAIQPGGAEIIAKLLAKYARSPEDKVYIVTVRKPKNGPEPNYIKDFLAQLKRANVDVIDASTTVFPYFVPINALKFIIKNRVSSKDLVHLHTDIPEFFGAFVRLFSNAKIIRTIHNSVFWPENPVVGKFVEKVLRDSQRVGVTDRVIVEHNKFLKNKKIKPLQNATTIYNGVEFDTSYEDINIGLTLEPSALNFLFIGRLEHQKGIDVLIDAVSLLSQQLKSYVVHVIGEGPLKDELKGRVSRNSLPVTFYGAIPNASRLIGDADCVIIPSRFEGFGLVAAEAVLQGRPVIATDAPGLSEVFAGTNEHLIPVEDALKLAQAMTALISEPTMHLLSDETKEIFSKRYTAKAMAAAYLALYGE